MTNDTRCCGSGACIIDPEGRCWCGQVWDPPGKDQATVKSENPDDDAENSVSRPSS